jgi:O-antigen/teichoic acid export membrane protein
VITNENSTDSKSKLKEVQEPGVLISGEPENERRNVKWDLNNAFGNYFVLIIAQACVAIFSFSSIWLLNRYIGTDGYGTIVAVIAASQIIQVLISWTTISVSKFGTEEFVATGSISKSFWNRTYFLVLNLILVICASFFWFEPLSRWLKIQIEFFPYIIAHIVVTIFWLHIQFALQGSKLVRVQGILVAFEKFLIFAGLLILCLSSQINWFSAFSAYIFAPFLMVLVGMWFLRELIFPVSKLEFSYVRKILIFSFPLLPYSLIGYFSTSYLDVFFISQYLSKTDVGIYSIAYQVTGIVMQIPVLAGSILMPMFVTMQSNTDHNDQINAYFTKILPSICFAWTFVCALIATFGGLTLPFIFGEKFSDIHILLWIMMATAGILGPVLWGYGVMSNAKSLTYISTINAIIVALLNVFFNYLLIPRFGLIGCAWASVISNFFGTLAFIIIMNRYLQVKKSGVVLATLPIIIGAYFATAYNNIFLTLIFTIIACYFFFIFKRNVIFEVFIILRQRLFSQISFFNKGKA